MKRTSGTEKNFVMGIKSNYQGPITNWIKCSGLLLAMLFCLFNSEMRANNFALGNTEEISGIDLDWDFSEADSNLFQENFISCVGSVQLSLGQSGSSTLTPSIFLLGVAPPYTNYVVDIVGPLTNVVTCNEIGTTLMVKVTDTIANNSCWSSLNVEDKLAPVIICSPDTLPCGTDIANIDFESLIDSLSDNCDDDLTLWFNQDFVDFDCDPQFAGKVVRTWHAIDDYGNESTCTQEVYLEKAPIDSVIFPINDTLYCPIGSTEPEVTGEPTLYGEPLSAFCEIMAFHNDMIIPTCGCDYKIRRTWTVMDWCTLESRVMDQFIVVQDSIGPQVTCPADINLGTDSGQCNSSFIVPAPTITSSCGCSSNDYNIQVTFDPFQIPVTPGEMVNLDTGVHVLTYTIRDECGLMETCTTTVTVKDNESPTLNCSNLEINLDNNGFGQLCLTDLDFTYFDNCAIVDTQIRRMPDLCNTPANEIFGDCVTFCCEDIMETVMVQVQVTDAAGNVNSCMVPVIVDFKLTPDAITCANDTVVAAGANCEAFITLADPVIVSGCPVDFEATRDDGLALTDAYPKGETVVTFFVPGPNGPIVSCETNVMVNDSTPPTITCLPTLTAGTNNGECSAVLTLPNAIAVDNCTVEVTAVRSDSLSMTAPFLKGETTITYTATDCGNNIATCTRLIIVEDDDFPTIVCPDDYIVSTDPGVCFASAASVNLPDPVTDDNCPMETFIGTRSDGEALSADYPKGETTITYVVTDCGNNTAMCSFTVTVEDQEDPTITCPDDIDAFTSPGECTAIVMLPPPVVNDNCPEETITTSRSDGAAIDAPFMIGMTRVMYTITDCGMNTDTCSFIVMVMDTMSPMITCPNDTIVDANANCEAFVTLPSPMTSDNCPMVGFIALRSDSLDLADAYPKGTTTITYIAMGIGGNTATCMTTVTVEDNTPPVVTCAPDIVVGNDPGTCNALVTIPDPTITDNCTTTIISIERNDMLALTDPYPKGETTVTYTIEDCGNNIETCSLTVTVNDTEFPIITCPSPVTIGTDAGVCVASATSVNLSAPTATDNCMPLTFAGTRSDGLDLTADYQKGITTVTFIVTDCGGNMDTCITTVTVEDNEFPMITCPAPIIVGTDADACFASADSFTLVQPTISDNCPQFTVVGIRGDGLLLTDDYPKGDTRILYTITDCGGNIDTCSTIVTVIDDDAPMITCPGNIAIDAGVNCDTIITLPDAIVVDNCDLPGPVVILRSDSLPITDPFEVGTTTVTYSITDCGNLTESCTITVTVTDNTPPTIVCPPNITVDAGIDCDTVLVLPDPVVNDNCMNLGFVATRSDNMPLTAPYLKGTTTITYTAGGVSCTTTVTVEDNTGPSIICPAPINVGTDANACFASADSFIIPDPIVLDNCPQFTVVATRFDGMELTDNYLKGDTRILFTVTDCGGNIDTCSTVVTVIDDDAPMITCPADIVIDAGANCDTVITLPLATATDNCPITEPIVILRSDSLPLTDPFSMGTTMVTYTVTDCGNLTASCTISVTVMDNTPPTIVCPDPVVVGTNPDSCNQFVTLPDPVINDNCTMPSFTATRSDGLLLTDAYPKGVTTITYTTGGVSCTTTVTVQDDDGPMITCPADFTVGTDPSGCFALASSFALPDATVVDNCPDEVVVITRVDGMALTANYPKGPNRILYTVTDCGGNVDTCSMLVTVIDDDAPMITCPADIVIDAGANCDTVITLPLATATDNCPITEPIVILRSDSLPLTDPFSMGTTMVTYIVTDCGNLTASCTISVTVMDNTPATIVCPDPVIVGTNPDSCNQFVTLPDPVINDNCTMPSFTATRSDGLLLTDAYPKGVTTITYTTGGVSCTTTVTVQDDDGPMITCPADFTVGTDPSGCFALASSFALPDATVVDNCPDEVVVITRVDGMALTANYPKGPNRILYTVTDCGGNVDTCSMLVTVIDDDAPMITCPADIVVDAGANCDTVITLPLATATDNCPITEPIVILRSDSLPLTDPFSMGTTMVTYTVTDCGNLTASCTISVTVMDNTPATIVCPDPVVIGTNPDSCNQFVTLPDPVINDNCTMPSFTATRSDGLLLTDAYPKGVTTITYTTGGVSCTTTVTVQDDDGPMITCPADFTVGTDPSGCFALASSFTIPAATVVDNCPDEVVVITREDGLPLTDNYPIGTNRLIYTVTDCGGNIDTCSTIVTVIDDDPPTVICPPDFTVGTDDGICTATVPFASIPLPTFMDNCPDTTLSLSREDGLALTAPYPKDTTVLTWTLTDGGGNEVECSFNLIVVDDELPNVICPADITVNTDPGLCSADIQFPQIAFSDNCPDAVLSAVREDGMLISLPYPKGSTRVILQVTDCGGNIDTCSFLVIVEDMEAPTCITQDITVNIGDVIDPLDIDNGSSDNCTPVTFDLDQTVFGCGDVGPNMVVLTVFDTCGNSSMCNATVTVLPASPIVLTCPPDTVLFASATSCDATVSLIATAPGATNITNDSPVAASNNTGDASGTYPLGITIITFTASDSCGNADTCMTTVEVLDTVPPVIKCGKTLINITDELTDTFFISDIRTAFEPPITTDNCTAEPDLVYGFEPTFTQTFIAYDCSDVIGMEIFIPLFVRDLAGNISMCQHVVGVQDPNLFCPTPLTLNVGGNIHTEDGDNVYESMIEISNPDMAAEMTDVEGMYMFESLNSGNSYELVPLKDDDHLSGISTYDIVLIQKHLLGIELLNSPYKIIAADVNNTGSVSAIDMVNLRQLILGLRDDFPNNTSWRFVRDGFEFDDNYNPFVNQWPESESIDSLLFHDMHIDFTGVKVGDVNGSWIPNIRRSAPRNARTLNFNVEERDLEKGEIITVPFTANEFNEILGYQFTLGFNQNMLSFINTEAGELNMSSENFATQYTERGMISASWVGDVTGTSVENDKELFNLSFEVLENGKLSDALSINSRLLQPEAYQQKETDEVLNLAISFTNDGVIADDFELFQNRPNPFNGETLIEFRLQEASEATLEVYNAEGRLLKSYQHDGLKGINQILIYQKDLEENGVLYYKLSTPKFTATRKMIAF